MQRLRNQLYYHNKRSFICIYTLKDGSIFLLIGEIFFFFQNSETKINVTVFRSKRCCTSINIDCATYVLVIISNLKQTRISFDLSVQQAKHWGKWLSKIPKTHTSKLFWDPKHKIKYSLRLTHPYNGSVWRAGISCISFVFGGTYHLGRRMDFIIFIIRAIYYGVAAPIIVFHRRVWLSFFTWKCTHWVLGTIPYGKRTHCIIKWRECRLTIKKRSLLYKNSKIMFTIWRHITSCS